MDVYPTAHPKYVKDSEYDILKTLHTTLIKIVKQHEIDPDLRRATIALTITLVIIQQPPFTTTYIHILKKNAEGTQR